MFVTLILFAVSRSKRLSDFLESMSDERLSFSGKLQAFWKVFGGQKQ
jgi:hypothetical protein